jgi:hypothetical protein
MGRGQLDKGHDCIQRAGIALPRALLNRLGMSIRRIE